MTAPNPREPAATPWLWRALCAHLRAPGSRFGRDDVASATMASYVVGAAVFVIGSSVLLTFSLEPPKTAGLEANQAKANARGIMDILLGTAGYPLNWKDDPDNVKRLGLLDEGASARLDPDKFLALSRGRYLEPNITNGFVDYAEARRALGLEAGRGQIPYDFHLRVYPTAPLATESNFGIVGMTDYDIAYIGHLDGAALSANAIKERDVLDGLGIGFSPLTRASPTGVGNVFVDSSTSLRTALVPLLGVGVPQSVVNGSSGAGTFDFARVDASELTGIVAPAPATSLTTALALTDGESLGYTKGREIRAVIGVANFSGVAAGIMKWNEFVDTNKDDADKERDAGDYGFVEVSPDGGQTWYAITDNGADRSRDDNVTGHTPPGLYKAREKTIDLTNCVPCVDNAEVHIAFHWVADGDDKRGYGWVIDDVQIVNTAFLKTFEDPTFDMVVIGSDVNQNALTSAEIKDAIRDYVELYGGRLVVLGGSQNTNWLQPLFHVGTRESSPGVADPDTTHPLLTVPNELAYGGYQHGGKVWDFGGAQDEDLFHMVVGNSDGHILAVSNSEAYGGGATGGSVILTTYLPHLMSTGEASKFFANAITYGRYNHLYMDIGPAVPEGHSVSAVTRTATMDKTANRTGEFIDLAFVLYVWQGNSTAQGSSAALRTPGAPTWSSSGGQNQTIWLNWTAPSYLGAGPIERYELWRGTMKGATTFYRNVSGTSFVDLNVTNGITYWYNVSAVNDWGGGYASTYSNVTPAAVPYPVETPQVTGGAGQMIVSWLPPPSTGGSSLTHYVLHGNNSTSQLAKDVSLETSYTHSALDAQDLWTYWVVAHNAKGESAPSGKAYGETLAIPATPTGLAATPDVASIRLTWTAIANLDTITGYKLYRGTALGAYSQLSGDIPKANVTFSDYALSSGTTYYYVLVAYNDDGESTQSNAASAATLQPPDAPVVTATAGTGGAGLVNLTIVEPDNTGGATSVGWYHIYRRPASDATPVLAHNITSNGTTTTWIDRGLTPGTLYNYSVAAVTGAGAGLLSNPEASAIASAVPDPVVLAAEALNGGVDLTWAAATGGVTGYTIYRGPSDGNWTYTTTLGAVTAWTDTNVSKGVVYYYAVTAHNENGEGAKSASVAATPLGVADPPVLAALTGTDVGTVRLDVTAPSNTGGAGITHYELYRSAAYGISGSATFRYNITYGGPLTTYTDTGLTGGATYYYYVKAVNSQGTSGASAEALAVAKGLDL